MNKISIKKTARMTLIITGIAVAGGIFTSCAKGEGGNPPSTVFDTPSSTPRGSH